MFHVLYQPFHYRNTSTLNNVSAQVYGVRGSAQTAVGKQFIFYSRFRRLRPLCPGAGHERWRSTRPSSTLVPQSAPQFSSRSSWAILASQLRRPYAPSNRSHAASTHRRLRCPKTRRLSLLNRSYYFFELRSREFQTRLMHCPFSDRIETGRKDAAAALMGFRSRKLDRGLVESVEANPAFSQLPRNPQQKMMFTS